MRSLILVVVAAITAGCTSSGQSEPVTPSGETVSVAPSGGSTSRGNPHSEQCLESEGADTLEANEPFERTPIDGLHVRFRVPPGWQISTIQHNYIGLRSGRDSAFITVWCDDGSVEWGITYYTADGDTPMTCRHGYQGEANSTRDCVADYQSYMDDTDEQVYIHVNWPDLDAIYAFAEALALRDGGECRPSR